MLSERKTRILLWVIIAALLLAFGAGVLAGLAIAAEPPPPKHAEVHRTLTDAYLLGAGSCP